MEQDLRYHVCRDRKADYTKQRLGWAPLCDLCDFGPISQVLWALILFSVKWGCLEGYSLGYRLDESLSFYYILPFFSNESSNEGIVGETTGPFAAKLGERGPHGLDGKEASSEKKGQSPGVSRRGQENAEGLFGPGKGFWDELRRAFVRFPCTHEIRAVAFNMVTVYMQSQGTLFPHWDILRIYVLKYFKHFK